MPLLTDRAFHSFINFMKGGGVTAIYRAAFTMNGLRMKGRREESPTINARKKIL